MWKGLVVPSFCVHLQNFCSSLYSVRAGEAQSVQCLGQWLAVRGILIQYPASKDSFFSTKCPDGLQDPLSSLFNGFRVLFPRGLSGRDVKLTTHSHLLLNNQPDALIIQIYSVIKLHMFQASSDLQFHPDSAWKRSSKSCMKLTIAECTVENS